MNIQFSNLINGPRASSASVELVDAGAIQVSFDIAWLTATPTDWKIFGEANGLLPESEWMSDRVLNSITGFVCDRTSELAA